MVVVGEEVMAVMTVVVAAEAAVMAEVMAEGAAVHKLL
jgi:hypothetical protein